jgi:flavin reductase (DIM6/NTAB) family NADH-FMN oxidoreductase RutF
VSGIDTTPMRIDAAQLRRAFGCFPSGLVAACSLADDGRPVGMTLSTFVAISLDPPLVSVSIQNTSSTWPALVDRPRIGLSVLAADHGAISRQLASNAGDRFTAVDWTATESGAVFIAGASLWLETTIAAEYPVGDHQVVILELHRVEDFPDVSPLVYHASRLRPLGDDIPCV